MPLELQQRFPRIGAAAMLHGVDLPANDIDILLREREDVDAWCGAFSGFECLEPVKWIEWTRQYYAFTPSSIGIDLTDTSRSWLTCRRTGAIID
jgi:hypothetical protein